MTEDDDKEVVAAACTNTAEIMQDCGYMALQPCKPSLFSQTFCDFFNYCYFFSVLLLFVLIIVLLWITMLEYSKCKI